jgi:hypothetical protein
MPPPASVLQGLTINAGGTNYSVSSGAPVAQTPVIPGAQKSMTLDALIRAVTVIQPPTPLVARSGPVPQSPQNQYANRPRIEIYQHQGVNGTGVLLGKFDSWICNNVQEQDAEKFDVVETFGNPHLFAVGRFIRRYEFSGFLRAAPANYANTADANFSVSQSTLFRVFYDKYLRSSQQSKTGCFTRIVIDSEAYVGYVTTLNFHRNADHDITGFVFSFVALDRYNILTETDAAGLLTRFIPPSTTPVPLAANVAQAELANAQGALTLTAPVSSVVITQPFTSASSAPQGGSSPLILKADGSPQTLNVSSDTPGLELQYASTGTPVNGAPAPTGSSTGVPLQVVVTNYAQLFQAITQQPSSSPLSKSQQLLVGTVNFTVTGMGGNSVTFAVTLSLTGSPQVTCSGFSVQAAGASASWSGSGTSPVIVSIPAASLTFASPVETIPAITFDFTITDEQGNIIPQAVLSTATISAIVLNDLAIYPNGGGAGTPSPGETAKASFATGSPSSVIVASVTSPKDGLLEVAGTATFVTSPITNLNSSNPFTASDGVLISFTPVITIPGYAPISNLPPIYLQVHFESNGSVLTAIQLQPSSISYPNTIIDARDRILAIIPIGITVSNTPSNALLTALQATGNIAITISWDGVVDSVIALPPPTTVTCQLNGSRGQFILVSPQYGNLYAQVIGGFSYNGKVVSFTVQISQNGDTSITAFQNPPSSIVLATPGITPPTPYSSGS